jgi:hypothetical protein
MYECIKKTEAKLRNHVSQVNFIKRMLMKSKFKQYKLNSKFYLSFIFRTI